MKNKKLNHKSTRLMKARPNSRWINIVLVLIVAMSLSYLKVTSPPVLAESLDTKVLFKNLNPSLKQANLVRSQDPMILADGLRQSTLFYAYAPLELTESGRIIDIFNYGDTVNTITFYVHNSSGTLLTGYPKTLILRPYENKTLDPGLAENLTACGAGVLCGLDLTITNEGTPAIDTAYGMIITASEARFGLIGSFDKRESGAGGGGKQTYNLQPELYNDSWWGMYNYSSADIVKQDYFHIFNANNATTTVVIDVYQSDGTIIDANGSGTSGTSKVITFNPYQTQKIFPQTDLNVATNQQDISIHLTADNGVAIHVSSNLGDNYNFDNGEYTSWDNVAGGWVPWPTDQYQDSYYFTNTVNSSSLAAVSVTNINNVPTDVTWSLYPYDSTPTSYTRTITIAAHGTQQLLLPNNPSGLKDESISSPWFHGNSLTSSAGPIEAHVSYQENIDSPVMPLNDFWYGVRDSSRTQQWMLFNPNATDIDITCDTYYYTTTTGGTVTSTTGSLVNGARGPSRPPSTSNTVTLGTYDVLATNPSDTSYGPSFSADKDQLVHCYSDSPWTIELQEPDYGDVTPLQGGYYPPFKPQGSIGDFVWEDLDLDGVQDEGEPGIEGVQVLLYIEGETNPTATTYTDANGEYLFSDLGINNYYVKFILPEGYAFTDQDQGMDDTLDSDPNPTTGETEIFTLGPNDDITTVDAGLYRPAVIGNYIWLDEDGDGDQDAGEDGIANVTVNLLDDLGNTIATTTTDANGGYIFTDVPPGDYTVQVDSNTLPAGLAANPTYDEDGIGTLHTTTVILTSGEEHMTADFGYNWSSPTETNTNTGTGAIGDRVWIDADGDGVQDPGEAGLGGVNVTIYYDPDGDGIYDTPYTEGGYTPTTTTAVDGSYVFDTLPAGSYVIEVDETTLPVGITWTQTGDPDEDGTCSDCDDKTTSPIVLAPGDVFVNADFGYNPDTGSTIGDQVFIDADGDGMQDAGEPGIPGVTVALEDSSGNIIATTVTDENGTYTFPDLPAGEYTVVVTDTENVLGELDPISDDDGIGTPNQSTTTVNGTDDDLDQDFGYGPPGHDGGEGLIGDTIFIDTDNSGTLTTGEGVEGVTVQLYDATGTILLATTTTDENGNYYFGNLPAGDYVVKVDTTTLPPGLTNTVDPDGGTLNESNVNLTEGEVDLTQDFGYRETTLPNSVGGTIWEDTDADGTQDLDETTVFPGVTVDLYYDTNNNGILDAGDELVGTTSTDSAGHYEFSGLPDGTYFVDVTDDENLLEGYWHSLGTQGEADDGQSKEDAYLITLSGDEERDTVDFGYYIEPAGVGNRVWIDSNDNGIQDEGEVGIPNYPVYLTITYPDTTEVTIMTYTDENGYYSFDNLLLDEDFDGVGGGEPTYVITVPILSNTPTSPNIGGDNTADSDGVKNQSGFLEVIIGVGGEPGLVQGLTIVDYDFGFTGTPTGIDLMFFSAEADKKSVTLTWETVNEIDNLGFNLFRAEALDGERVQINSELITSNAFPGSPSGALYEFVDTGEDLKSHKLQPNHTYYYWLEQVDRNGAVKLFGPLEVTTVVENKKIGDVNSLAIGEIA